MESAEKPNEISENIDAPVVRRRRRIVRHHVREKTPEPSKNGGTKQKYSDDESSTAEMTGGSTSSKKSHHRSHQQHATDASTNTAAAAAAADAATTASTTTTPLVETIDEPPNDVLAQPTVPVVKSAAMSAHRSKILSRRDRSISTAAVRSQSTPRDESKANDSGITLLIRQAKRSLSSPRYVSSI